MLPPPRAMTMTSSPSASNSDKAAVTSEDGGDALYGDLANFKVSCWPPLLGVDQNIMHGITCASGDQSNAGREKRDRLFAFRRKEALCGKFAFQCLELCK